MNVDKQTDLSSSKLEAADRHISQIQKLAKQWTFHRGSSPFKEKTRQFCTKMKFLPFFKIYGRAGGGQNHSVGLVDLSSSLRKGISVMSLLFQSPSKENFERFLDIAEIKVAFLQWPRLHQ